MTRRQSPLTTGHGVRRISMALSTRTLRALLASATSIVVVIFALALAPAPPAQDSVRKLAQALSSGLPRPPVRPPQPAQGTPRPPVRPPRPPDTYDAPPSQDPRGPQANRDARGGTDDEK